MVTLHKFGLNKKWLCLINLNQALIAVSKHTYIWLISSIDTHNKYDLNQGLIIPNRRDVSINYIQ